MIVIVFESETVPPAVAKPVALFMVTPVRINPLVLAVVAVSPVATVDPPLKLPSQVVRRMAAAVVKTLEQRLELELVDSTVKPVPKTTALAVVGPAENDAPVTETLPERPATGIGSTNLTKMFIGPRAAVVAAGEAKA